MPPIKTEPGVKIKSEPGVRIKTEPGVRVKSEHGARFDLSSIPRPPGPSAPVKQEDRKPERIFERLRKAHFNIEPTEPSGFLCRKVEHLLFGSRESRDTISVKEQFNSERESVTARIPNITGPRQNGNTKAPSSSTSSSPRSQPATSMSQVPYPSVSHNKSQGMFDMFRPKEQSTTIAHPVAPEGTFSPSFGSSSTLTSGLLFKDSGNQITDNLSKSSLGPPSSSTTFSLFDPSPGPNPFRTLPPNRSLFGPSTIAHSGFFGRPSSSTLFGPSTVGNSGLFAKPQSPNRSRFAPSTVADSGIFGKPPSPNRPLLAATTKPVPEVIDIDSSPESSPPSSPQKPPSKERAAGK
ncbi:hypothetical protein QBC32DRAFT_382389 [Pseudoneurospora amorphoporcata]|uniref:Uncharacterized protein n=1 Tax=Pseudoneurospora amorphoporcata TaxID=241081 RepID=A0AAN6SIV2_9PEZI|nr:hypothetical protein QBC32DRAFT_382389 [Pseudoneurospora amorphoporcata]